jgi:ABC-type glycerol-3-phosphate transport system substrate-binding protein
MLWSYSIDETIPAYNAYFNASNAYRPDHVYIIEAVDYLRYMEDETDVQPFIYDDVAGMEGEALLTAENALVEYQLTVEETGYYDLSLVYYPAEGKGAEIQRSFLVDGKLPCRELALIQFPRVWQNDKVAAAACPGYGPLRWDRDNQGNDIKPGMRESPMWIRGYLYDSDGFITRQLSLHLTAGTHILTIHSLREPLLLRRIILDNPGVPALYQEQLSEWNMRGAADTTGILIELAAQDAIRTSSQMLYPVQDASSPNLTPNSTRVLLNNTIGGNAWRYAGQWIEWDFSVPVSGYYCIGFNVKQNFRRGTYVSRKISLDGAVPFLQMEDYGFMYAQNWRQETLSGEEDIYRFYLEANRVHTLRMEAVLGGFSHIISTVRDTVYDLNRVYRKVIRLTGAKPDKYRDYQIERTLPELGAELLHARDTLDLTIDDLRRTAGHQSERERVLVTMRDQLNDLIKDCERFPRVLESFKINVLALGTWLNESMLQPLQLDMIQIHSPDVKPALPKDNVFSKISFELSRLFYSFIIDYNRIGNVDLSAGSDTITLWIGSGRDQANTIKSLIDERFTPFSGINVNVMLVDMGTLLQATLAGQGPDVALQVSNDLPMNYGLRNAVMDLSVFSDLHEVRERFHESAMTPFEFDGATYALPETQVFPMMFYRKDILYELGLKPPDTWDDVKIAMAVLAKNMMEFGMLPSEQVFAMLLYQNGGAYYNADATRSALDSEEAIHAFKIYTEFYTDYKLDRATSIEERFRTGETPIIIADYTTFNNLQISAPDLKGMWGFAPVPGTRCEDGTINRTVAGYGGALTGNTGAASGPNTVVNNAGACVIMNTTVCKEAAWEFIKWWTSAQTQAQFGREMESLMGSSARVPTANQEAFAMLPWSVADFKALREQFKSVKGIPQVPGGYFTYRNVSNAFYTVTTPVTDRPAGAKEMPSPREELTDKVILINEEIRYKRSELGFPTD